MQNFVRHLSVRYCGWGEDWLLGRLAEDGRKLLFEYSSQALARGLELSPLHLKLRTQAYGNFPAYLYGLPGLVADALPDGWGLLLMDRLFRQHDRQVPSPLERLAFIGDRALGALRFAPAHDAEAQVPDWNLLALARQSLSILRDEAEGGAEDVLHGLVLTGGSPQGARPKALIQYDADTHHVSTRMDAVGAPWLVKFPAQGEHGEVCAIEQLYMELARDCGLDVPASRWFGLSGGLAAFGVQRFDRHVVPRAERLPATLRVPVHSLAGLLHANFRLPGTCDYTSLLRATRLLTCDEREVEQAYARAVFNVVFHNRDDHSKNFAWRLGKYLEEIPRWRLAPAFDLTFSDGPGGQHCMDICGEGAVVQRRHLLQLAAEGGVAQKTALAMIERMRAQASRFARCAADFPIRQTTVRYMARRIQSCVKNTA